MRTSIRTLIPIVSLASLVCVAAAAPGQAAAGPAPGNKSSFSPDISASGRHVVFASDATNLGAGDTNAKRDIFLRDLTAGTTRLVSRGLGGRPANGASYFPSVSDNGRYVAFTSDASNLVTGDNNGARDAFRADLNTGKIVRISVGARGVQANGASDGARISGTGDAVVFTSAASNLAAKDTNRTVDVFLRSVTAGTTRRVSLADTGDQFDRASTSATISSDGSVVGFIGPSGYTTAVWEWRRSIGRTTPLAEGIVGSATASNGGVSLAFSDDGGECPHTHIEIRAVPVADSFSVSNDDCSGQTDYPLDVNRTGSLVAVSAMNYTTNKHLIFLLDDRYDLQNDPRRVRPKAWVEARPRSLALSGDGRQVAFDQLTTGTSQIQVWNTVTGSVATASVS